MARKQELQPYRKTFWFNYGIDGKAKPHKVPRRLGTKTVEIEMSFADLVNAEKAGGVGNSMLCAGAQCLQRYANAFPHAVFPPTDWLDTQVYITDKVDKFGLPLSCVQYTHDDRELAKMFDKAFVDPREYRKLKRLLKKSPIKITLRPARTTRSHSPPPGFVRRFTGARSGEIHDVILVDTKGEVVNLNSPRLPRPAAIGEVIAGNPALYRGTKHRFARAIPGLGIIRKKAPK